MTIGRHPGVQRTATVIGAVDIARGDAAYERDGLGIRRVGRRKIGAGEQRRVVGAGDGDVNDLRRIVDRSHRQRVVLLLTAGQTVGPGVIERIGPFPVRPH